MKKIVQICVTPVNILEKNHIIWNLKKQGRDMWMH